MHGDRMEWRSVVVKNGVEEGISNEGSTDMQYAQSMTLKT